MKRSAVLLLLLAPLAGCVNNSGPDLDAYDGPYYDTGGAYADGGAYYADPREFDYAVEQRALYGRTYYYPPAYPYYYGGYGRPRGWRGDHDGRRDEGRGRGDDRRNTNDARGVDRDRTRDDRGPAPAAKPDNESPRVIPSRPSKIATENRSPPPARSGTGNRVGGPRGSGKR